MSDIELTKYHGVPNLRFYNGNRNLKGPNVAIEWDPYMIEEYRKCSVDPLYFCEKYVKIVHVDKGLIPFVPRDYQVDMITSIKDNRNTIIATARQAGKSTSVASFILWYILFQPSKTVGLLANKGETAREILGRVQLAFEHLPFFLQQGVKEWNKGSLELENDSRVIASATSGDAIRGYTLNLLFIDEAAFIGNWDEFFTSVFPTIASGQTTKVVLVSTPNGLNHFYKLWKNAIDGTNGYHPIKVTWQDVPGRDQKWKEVTLATMNGDQEKFDQEYCVEFQGSSGTLVSGYKLKSLVHKNPIVENLGLSVFEHPQKGRTYAMVADVSRGKGLDFSAFSIIDVTTMPYKQVCSFRSNLVSPTDYTEMLFQIATKYNNCLVLIEINDIGGQVADMLHEEYEYENLIYTESAGRVGKRISSGSGKNIDRGIRTTKSVKSIGCSILKLLIEQDQLIVNSFETISELSTFSRKGRSYEAEPGKHDDLVMGLVLFAWLSNQPFFREMTDIHTLSKLREKSEQQMIDDLIPFGFIDQGHPDDSYNGSSSTSDQNVDPFLAGNW